MKAMKHSCLKRTYNIPLSIPSVSPARSSGHSSILPETDGTSEFFFNLEAHPDWDGSFSIFGRLAFKTLRAIRVDFGKNFGADEGKEVSQPCRSPSTRPGDGGQSVKYIKGLMVEISSGQDSLSSY
ncbi:hypothetical protein R1flu_005834 [Riccia fluitans]|uniref:Peptidylprolyl isomerase n=1 Tax=Riccia fluitans TaxID=41844 RepID=A0ABD1YUA4_9MARC